VNGNREYEAMSGGDPNRFPLRRYKFKRAGIKHFQRPLLEKDLPEAEKILETLIARANEAYLKISEIVDLELAEEADPVEKVRTELIRLNSAAPPAWSKRDIRDRKAEEISVEEELS
jgi:hypothetical protein